MTNDPIERAIGRFGWYQTWILILITLGRFPAEFQLTNVVFILPNVEYTCLDDPSNNATNICPCENPVYDKSTIVDSVTTTWNLICERGTLASFAQSVLQAGILAGSLIYGHISDRHGRKTAVVLALFLEAVSVIVSAVVPQFWMFIASRFFIGVSLGGTMLCCYVHLIELSGTSFVPYIIGLIEVSYMSGYLFLPMIAYFVREWRHLQLITSIPWIITISFYWLLPESPRWLITVGQNEEAIRVLTFIAKKNKLPTENIASIVNKIDRDSINETQYRGSYLDLFKTPKIRLYTIITAVVWFCTSHTFFGVNQYIGRLPGDLYLNVILSAAALAPGLIICVIGALYFKRKAAVIFSFAVTGLALLVFIFIPSDMTGANLTLAIVSQISAYNAFVQVYLNCSEVFPTVIRNSALGFASVFARVGGFIAPFVVNIGIEWVSILVFSSLALVAAILSCFLPETKNIVLLNTISQREEKKSKSIEIEPEFD
ncbi:hypothetical protein JYU34_017522 [Plutella xylostella]|uniref:Major facilitator superfamily (MFS) profile domain-containing protein n=2 Tax=Plutella xylostella TaxID=51655 RepID=A0ABQ7Q1F1_PLUXY|nr:hypothetical protein JYU34_017522 [Plutella xylostella]